MMVPRNHLLSADSVSYPIEQGIENYRHELHEQELNPPSGDQIIARFCLAQLRVLEEEKNVPDVKRTFTRELAGFVGARGVAGSGQYPSGALGASEAVGIVRASFQADQLSRSISEPLFEFPRSYLELDPDEAVEHMARQLKLLSAVHQDDDYHGTQMAGRKETFAINLLMRSAMTSVSDRYVLVELAMQVLRERYSEKLRWLDAAAGVMQGVNRLALKDIYPFSNLAVIDPPDEHQKTRWDAIDMPGTEKVLEILRRPSLLRECVAIDLMDIRHPDVQRWAKGSMRPMELADDEFIGMYDRLAHPDYEQIKHLMGVDITFEQGDVTSIESIENLKQQQQGQKFQLITILTALHQMPQSDREQAIGLLLELLDDDGVMIVGDFVHSRGRTFSAFKQWHIPGHYQYYVLDRKVAAGRWQKLGRANSSRVESVQLSPGKLWTGKSEHAFTDLVANI